MKRLGKRNNGLSIIMEGNVGKVMKGGKLLERVRFERGSGGCNIFCPQSFHDNTDTPAAKLFRDEDGDRIWCFAENKMYRPYDVFRLKLIKTSARQVYDRIWNQLDESQRNALIEESGIVINTLPDRWKEFKDTYCSLYREGKITCGDLISHILMLEE